METYKLKLKSAIKAMTDDEFDFMLEVLIQFEKNLKNPQFHLNHCRYDMTSTRKERFLKTIDTMTTAELRLLFDCLEQIRKNIIGYPFAIINYCITDGKSNYTNSANLRPTVSTHTNVLLTSTTSSKREASATVKNSYSSTCSEELIIQAISEYLKELLFDFDLQGTTFLCTAFKIMILEKGTFSTPGKTSLIYKKVAKEHHVTPVYVKEAIQHAINCACYSHPKDVLPSVSATYDNINARFLYKSMADLLSKISALKAKEE